MSLYTALGIRWTAEQRPVDLKHEDRTLYTDAADERTARTTFEQFAREHGMPLFDSVEPQPTSRDKIGKDYLEITPSPAA